MRSFLTFHTNTKNPQFNAAYGDVVAKRRKPAGAGHAGKGGKIYKTVTIADAPAQVKYVVKSYSVKQMGALNGTIQRNEESDLLLSNITDVSVEDLEKIRKELLEHEKTQHLKEKVMDKSGRMRNRQPPELLINTLLYFVAFDMVNWEDGQEKHYMRLTK